METLYQGLPDFLDQNHIGVLMRTFDSKETNIPGSVQLVAETSGRLRDFQINGSPVFDRIDVLVWKDQRHHDSDCGKTAEALQQAIRDPGINIQEMDGDLFCGLMNSGIGLQTGEGMDYTVSISPDANSYATPETLTSMMEAASRGALAVGVAIDELTQSILEGRIANTFAMWHNLTLIGVGGFDLKAAKPSDDRLAHYIRGMDEAGNEIFYPFAGVEEVIPLARIFDRLKRPFIAPISPSGEGVRQYVLPSDPDHLKRHTVKMASKNDRQLGMLISEGFNFSWLKGAVRPEYRRF